jgi:plasmid maintenance system antidote protein VapI
MATAQIASRNEIRYRGISPDTALRLAKFFGTSERFWLNLQGSFDLASTKKIALAHELEMVQVFMPNPTTQTHL